MVNLWITLVNSMLSHPTPAGQSDQQMVNKPSTNGAQYQVFSMCSSDTFEASLHLFFSMSPTYKLCSKDEQLLHGYDYVPVPHTFSRDSRLRSKSGYIGLPQTLPCGKFTIIDLEHSNFLVETIESSNPYLPGSMLICWRVNEATPWGYCHSIVIPFFKSQPDPVLQKTPGTCRNKASCNCSTYLRAGDKGRLVGFGCMGSLVGKTGFLFRKLVTECWPGGTPRQTLTDWLAILFPY